MGTVDLGTDGCLVEELKPNHTSQVVFNEQHLFGLMILEARSLVSSLKDFLQCLYRTWPSGRGKPDSTFLAGPSATALILPGVRALLMSPFKGPCLTGQLGHFSRTLGVTFILCQRSRTNRVCWLRTQCVSILKFKVLSNPLNLEKQWGGGSRMAGGDATTDLASLCLGPNVLVLLWVCPRGSW